VTVSSIDLFLSHSSGDAVSARQLRAALETAGYRCWMAPDDVVGKDTWTEQILEAIAASRAMVVLISSRANASEHVSREVNLALGRKHPVLPIRIEPVGPEGSLEYLLSLVQRVDAFPPPLSAHVEPILKRITALIGDGTTTRVTTKATPPRAPTARRTRAAKAPPPAEATAGPAAASATEAGTPLPDGRLAEGTLVGEFTVESVLGEGGMGTVYRARQAEPSRAVALKVIRADHAVDPSYRRQFLAEKDTLASLEHPAIVPIYAAGEAGGRLYIAMRLLEGDDLSRRIASHGHLGMTETIRLLRPIADALDYAHRRGVIHRDIKPSNIVLDRDDRPYLTDFGLGMRVSAPTGGEPTATVGTLQYMAPEQFTPSLRDDSAALDVYALGCVAWACLTGNAPFTGQTPDQVAAARGDASRPMPPSGGAALSPAVQAAIRQALATNPHARFSTATGFIEALDLAGSGSDGPTVVVGGPSAVSPSVRAAGWLRAHRVASLTGGVVAAVLAVSLVGAVIGPHPGPSGSPAHSQVAVATPTPTPAATPPDRGSTDPATWSADQRQLLAALPTIAVQGRACAPWTPGTATAVAPDGYIDALAKLSCRSESGPDVHYLLYPPNDKNAALDAEYAAFMDDQAVDTGGNCTTGPPANATWNWGETDTFYGSLACFSRESSVEYVWTDHNLHVLAEWDAPTNATGRDFWLRWTKSLNAAEQHLLATLPDVAGSATSCHRAADAYYDTATAILTCAPPTSSEKPVYFALFAAPSDMTRIYEGIVNFPVTTEGCWDSSPANARWAYGDDPDRTPHGSLGCYSPAAGGVQFVWTVDKLEVAGFWLAVDRETGMSFFNPYVIAIRAAVTQ
jgi:serine/threonine-protein kinase